MLVARVVARRDAERVPPGYYPVHAKTLRILLFLSVTMLTAIYNAFFTLTDASHHARHALI